MTRRRPRFVFTGKLDCERTGNHDFTFTRTWGDIGFLECDCGETLWGMVREGEWRERRDEKLAERSLRAQERGDLVRPALPRVVSPTTPQARRRGRPRTEEMIERDRRILALARSKVTGREIAQREGITEARVWQILRRMRSPDGGGTTGSGVATPAGVGSG